MTFLDFSNGIRKELAPLLDTFLKEQSVFTKVSPWGEDLRQRLLAFVSSGKLLRGSLVVLSYEMFSGTNKKDALKMASALELFHSSLLIHDDIMDQDRIRRGHKTLFAQYQDLAKEKGMENPKRTGESLAICAGDMGFFLGYKLLSTLSLDSKITMKLFQTISEELSLVGLGQMQDVALSAQKEIPKEEDILSVYRYKTARYTFSLPLMLGAILAGKDDETLEILIKLGETVGVIFQIKDDELNLFGDEKQIGKSVGSDIREGKKTLYHYYLSQNPSLRQTILPYFGNESLTSDQIEKVRSAIKGSTVQQEMDSRINELSEEFQKELDQLPINEVYMKMLLELLDYVQNRAS